MDSLPPELYDNIFIFLKDLDPLDLYKIRLVSKKFQRIIDNLKYNYTADFIKNNISLQNKINRLTFSSKSVNVFGWLFKNNIFLTDNNIINIVSNNRLDILKECIKYNEILNNLFNDKYSILIFNSQKLVQSESPLIIAGVKGYYDIVKFLIEIPLMKNPFHQQIDILIEDILYSKNSRSLIKYLCTYHYDKFIHKHFTTEKILKGLDDCEDLIFYLLKSNKICINNVFIITCIEKNYTKSCIYGYKKISDNLLIPGENIVRIFKTENIDLLDYFILKYPNHFTYIKKNLYKLQVSKKIFFHIFNNYLKYMDVTYPIIELYLEYEQNIDTLKMLVNNNYIVTKKSLIISLDFSDKSAFKILSEKYLKYNN